MTHLRSIYEAGNLEKERRGMPGRRRYSDLTKGIHETTEYLELFLRNLLLGEQHDLKNRYLNVLWDDSKAAIEIKKQDIETEKQDIESKKQDIGTEKQDIGARPHKDRQHMVY